MAYRTPTDAAQTRDRTISATIVVAIHAAFGLMLLTGPAAPPSQGRNEAVATFDVAPPSPPPPPARPRIPTKVGAREAKRLAARPDRSAPAKPVAAPVVEPLPLPAMVAPRDPADGAADGDASPTPGAGLAAGGPGEDMGSGARGSGTGGGETHARLIHGAIGARDYPSEARRAGAAGSVTVRFTVGRDGRARDCSVTRTSGVVSLDATTCRLVEKRFRYDPARDAAGAPVSEDRGWRQDWWLENSG